MVWLIRYVQVQAGLKKHEITLRSGVRIINDLPDSVWYLVIIVFTATFSTKMTDKVLNRNKKK